MGDPVVSLPIDALAESAGLRLLLTRVGREQPPIASMVTALLAAAAHGQVAVEVIDIPDRQHSLDILDHQEQPRETVRAAMAWVVLSLS